MGLFESFRDPELYQGLTGHSDTPGFSVEGVYHPDGEVHVDAFLLKDRPSGIGEVQMLRNAVTGIELLVELLSGYWLRL